MRNHPKVGDVLGCDAYGPCPLEPHHPRPHGADVDLAVGRDDADQIRSLELVDGPLGHDQGVLSRIDRGPYLRVLTWAEDVPWVRE